MSDFKIGDTVVLSSSGGNYTTHARAARELGLTKPTTHDSYLHWFSKAEVNVPLTIINLISSYNETIYAVRNPDGTEALVRGKYMTLREPCSKVTLTFEGEEYTVEEIGELIKELKEVKETLAKFREALV